MRAKRDYRTIERGAGNTLCVVPLGPDARHGECILDKTDMDRLLALGLSTNWTLNGKTVTAYAPNSKNKHVGVARVIMGAGRGEQVVFRNGISTDLRIGNLRIRNGFGTKADVLYVLKEFSVER